MPDSHNRSNKEFEKYDSMSTEDLQKILREDASKPVGNESDTEALFYVMDVLAKRRQARNEGKSPEEALETFKQKYYTENDISFDSESNPAARRRHGVSRWIKGLVAAAAMLAFIVGDSFTANAMGFDVWEVIAKWTQETFHFGYAGEVGESNAPSSDFEHPCASLQEALSMRDITTALVPTWLPEGYSEGDVEITQTPKHRAYTAIYDSSNGTIRIRIADYLDSFPAQIEKSDSLIEIYSIGDVDYYIFNNIDQIKAVWLNNQYECYIIAPVSISEIKEMLDSIGKG